METIHIRTSVREEMVNITSQVQARLTATGLHDGALVLFCPHTTAGLTVNEAADPDVVRDMTAALSRLVPRDNDYRHAEGNSDAHIKASLFGPSLTLIVENGRLRLGTWQGVYFCECDGPRQRTVWLKPLG